MSFRPQKIVLPILCSTLLLTACSRGTPEQKEARYLKHGNELFDQAQYEKARVEYRNAARIKPTDAEVSYRMGLVDEAEGHFHEAYVNFTHAEQQDAHHHAVLLKLAEYYLAGDAYEQAEKRIAAVLADSPDEPEAHAMQAALSLKQKNYADTEKEARIALEKDPNNVTAFAVLTGLYNAQNDTAKAITTVEDGISRNPKNMALLLLKADLYEGANDIPKTAEAYDAIFKAAPSDVKYRLKLAGIYVRANKLDEAEAVLRAGVEAQPANWEMKHQLVLFLGEHRSADVVEKEIQTWMEAFPKQNEPYIWLVDYDLSHNATDKALALLNQIVAKDEYNKLGLFARTALARISYIKGDKAGAERLNSTVLGKDPNNLDALFLQARMEADKGNYEQAVIDLRAILRDRPKTPEALQLLGETLLTQGHVDLAIETLNQLVESDPLNYGARVRLAQLYHLNKDSQHAMDMLFLVTKAEPKYAPGWETTARIAIDRKNWSTAETAIDKLDALQGQHMVATFLRGQLAASNNKLEDAVVQYKLVINDNPASPLASRALLSLVSVEKNLNKLEDVTHYMESLKSTNPVVQTLIGECWLKLGKRDLAIPALDAAIANNASSQDPYLDRAKLYLDEHKPDQAIEILKKAIAIAPGDLRASIMQADAYQQAGHYPESVALYDDILKRNPQMDAIANNLAEIIADYQFSDPSALERARQVAERFVATDNPLFMDTLAWVYYRQGNMQNAQSYMERAVTALGEKVPAQIRYHYGAILLKQGKTAEARTQLQKAVAAGESYPGIDDARKLSSGL